MCFACVSRGWVRVQGPHTLTSGLLLHGATFAPCWACLLAVAFFALHEPAGLLFFKDGLA
jgi:hypothetical protein